jgi:hypothetical protein
MHVSPATSIFGRNCRRDTLFNVTAGNPPLELPDGTDTTMDGWLFVEIPRTTKRCRACGADVPVGLKFCNICGQQLSAARWSLEDSGVEPHGRR